MKLFDSHIHLFAQGFPGTGGVLFPRGGEVRGYARKRKEFQIESALVVGYEGEAWCRGNNAYIARLKQRHPWAFPLAYVMPEENPAWSMAAWKHAYAGISIYITSERAARNVGEWPGAFCEELNACRAIVSINAAPEFLKFIRRFLERIPRASILLSHLGLPGVVDARLTKKSARGKLSPVLELATLSQVGVKLSGFYACSDPAYHFPHDGVLHLIEELHEAFGVERLYWGSDFAVALDYVSFPQTIAPICSYFENEDALALVLGGNLERLCNSA